MKKLSAMFIALLAALSWLYAGNDYENLKKFNEVLSLIENNYVEQKSVKDLTDGAINGMIATLDPFSQYMPPTAAKMMDSETKGHFGGLGIRITVRDKWLTVITPLPGTPAFRAGILPGDKIIRIEDKSTQGITVMDAVKQLRGKPGTKVKITVARDKETKDITITRADIKIQSVPMNKKKMLEHNIGYIQITEFSATTGDDFASAYNDLEKRGMKAMILDLRNNPGGLLKTAVAVAQQFLEKDQLVVYTKGRKKASDFKFFAQKTYHKKTPLVVLVNGGSASGAEIVAGAVKDWDRGILLGEKTFGKGSVQSLIALPDGSKLRLTTAKYYTPSGVCIHGKGIQPDIKVTISRDDQVKLMQQSETIYGLTPKQEEKRKENKIKDTQLERAKEILLAELKFSGELSSK